MNEFSRAMCQTLLIFYFKTMLNYKVIGLTGLQYDKRAPNACKAFSSRGSLRLSTRIFVLHGEVLGSQPRILCRSSWLLMKSVYSARVNHTSLADLY